MEDGRVNYFSVSMRKMEGTEHDYELISSLNPYFENLPKEKLVQIEDIVLKAVEDIQSVLRSHV